MAKHRARARTVRRRTRLGVRPPGGVFPAEPGRGVTRRLGQVSEFDVNEEMKKVLEIEAREWPGNPFFAKGYNDIQVAVGTPINDIQFAHMMVNRLGNAVGGFGADIQLATRASHPNPVLSLFEPGGQIRARPHLFRILEILHGLISRAKSRINFIDHPERYPLPGLGIPERGKITVSWKTLRQILENAPPSFCPRRA